MTRALLGLIIGLLSISKADASATQQLQIEREVRERVTRIVEKVDPAVIVQTRIVLKTLSSKQLPGVWFNAQVTPTGSDGDLNRESIDEIQVRVITQIAAVPDWIKVEVQDALKMGNAKIKIGYEKAKGAYYKAEDPLAKLPDMMNKLSEDMSSNLATNISNGLTTGLTTSLSTSLTNGLNSTLSNSISTSLSNTLPQAMSKGFGTSLSTSLSDSLTKSLNQTLPPALSSSLSKALTNVQQQQSGSEATEKGFKDIKQGLWGLLGGLVIGLLIVAFSVFALGGKIETALAKVIDERLGPLLQKGGGKTTNSTGGKVEIGSAKFDGAKAVKGGIVAGTGTKELADLNIEAILNLFTDCYWTEQDSYANYLWSQMAQPQREEFLQLAEVREYFYPYLTFIRQFDPVNLGYHSDARYLMVPPDLRKLSQHDLAPWLMQNTQALSRLTPLRWDYLTIPLADRLRLTIQASRAGAPEEEIAFAIENRSAARELPMKLEVKKITADDETYIWQNAADIPVHMRAGLKTLAWLALAPIEHRKKSLEEMDARQLAEAWIGPEEVLKGLQEALPAKKYEMVQFYLKETQPARETETFEILVEAGLAGYGGPLDQTEINETRQAA